PDLLRERRRKALQQLLRPEAVTAPVTFHAGSLLREQAEKREAQRRAAQERDERAIASRVVHAAIPRVIEAMKSEAHPDAKRRGRQRKEEKYPPFAAENTPLRGGKYPPSRRKMGGSNSLNFWLRASLVILVITARNAGLAGAADGA